MDVDERRATPLQKFIYEFEPGNNDKQWREGLSAALATVRREVFKEAIEITKTAHAQYKNQSSLRESIIDGLERASANQKGEVNG